MTVEQRVEKLERQNKWMRRMGAVAVALVAVVFLMGQGKDGQRTLECERLIIKKPGVPNKIVVGFSKNGTPTLKFGFNNRTSAIIEGGANPTIWLLSEANSFSDGVGKAGGFGLSFDKKNKDANPSTMFSLSGHNDKPLPTMVFFSRKKGIESFVLPPR